MKLEIKRLNDYSVAVFTDDKYLTASIEKMLREKLVEDVDDDTWSE